MSEDVTDWLPCSKCGNVHETMTACPEPSVAMSEDEARIVPSEIDRLINWLEAMECESKLNADIHRHRASAFREAALRARFAKLGMKIHSQPNKKDL